MKGISMKCPKCGYRRQTRDNAFTPATECPACGIVYSKHETNQPADPMIIGSAIRPHLKPSPVDAVSLKKARDRVEKRLRKQLEVNIKDQRHEETLKLARRFARQEVRRRLKTWQQGNPSEADAPDNLSSAMPPGPVETAPVDGQAPPDAALPSGDNATPDTEINPAADITDAATAPPENPHEGPTEAIPAEPTGSSEDESSDVLMETIILESEAIASPQRDLEPSAEERVEEAEAALSPGTEEGWSDLATLVAGRASNRQQGGRLMRLMPSIAWLILCSGVIGAVLSWTTISDVEAGVNITVPSSLNGLPLGLLLGFAYLATGVLGFAFFWVSSLISRQLRDIRRLLLFQPALDPGYDDDEIET
jgi:hypothetical protein